MGGFDSRLTRYSYVDLGGFITPGQPGSLDLDDAAARDYFRVRNGLYLLPGWRLPHRQPEGFNWDIMLRAGPAVVWSYDLSPNNAATPNTENYKEVDAAAMGGLDLSVRGEHWGVRLTGRAVFLVMFYEDEFRDVPFWTWQNGTEIYYQF